MTQQSLGLGRMAHKVTTTTPGDQILYVVGNGFDLHHGVRSSYVEFGQYLKVVDSETYDQLARYFSIDDDFWWQFEAQLANLDTDALLDDAGQYLPSYGADNWSDSGHHDYEYEIDRVVAAISSTLLQRFGEWVHELAIPPVAELTARLLPLRRDARYFTFNYTDTLQRAYGVPEANVVHIHGSAARTNDQLILGHGWQRTAADSLNHGIDFEAADGRELGGNDIIDRYFADTFKPTTRVIDTHRPFFQSLGRIRKIFVMGHSLSPVDLPYFMELRAHLDTTHVDWQVSFHGCADDAEEGMRNIGVDPDQIRFVPLIERGQWSCA